ncbi:MAG: prepilin peptidase [Acidimicrobiales bacterium]
MTFFLLVVALLAGLVVGSFVNVVVYRVPRGLSVVSPRSACPSCSKTITARDNVPVLSWLALRGRCRSCAVRIPLRYPAVELATAALFVALAARLGADAALPAFWLLVAALVAISAVDLERRLVPSRILYPSLVAGGVLLVLAAAAEGSWGRLWRAAAGGAIGFVALGVVHLVYPRGMGFGDVRLAGLLGVYLGWIGLAEVAVGLFLGFLTGSVVGLGLVAFAGRTGRSELPFAPFLAAGGVAGVLWGPALVRLWLG